MNAGEAHERLRRADSSLTKIALDHPEVAGLVEVANILLREINNALAAAHLKSALAPEGDEHE